MRKTRWAVFISVIGISSMIGCEPQAPRLHANNLVGQSVGRDLHVDTWLSAPPELQGKWILVDFWRTWCVPCLRSVRDLNEIHREFKQQLAIVSITNEDVNKARSLYHLYKVEYASGVDPDDKMNKTFGITGYPNLALIDPQGVVRWQGNPLAGPTKLTKEKLRQLLNPGV